MVARELYEPFYRTKLFLIARCTPAQANARLKKQFDIDADIDDKSAGMLIEHKDGVHFIVDKVYSFREIQHNGECSACSEHRAYQLAGGLT